MSRHVIWLAGKKVRAELVKKGSASLCKGCTMWQEGEGCLLALPGKSREGLKEEQEKGVLPCFVGGHRYVEVPDAKAAIR